MEAARIFPQKNFPVGNPLHNPDDTKLYSSHPKVKQFPVGLEELEPNLNKLFQVLSQTQFNVSIQI